MIKKLNERAIVPSQSREGDACYDLYILDDFVIRPHETVILPTGIAMEIPE